MVLAITQLISAITVKKEREKLLTSHQKGKKTTYVTFDNFTV